MSWERRGGGETSPDATSEGLAKEDRHRPGRWQREGEVDWMFEGWGPAHLLESGFREPRQEWDLGPRGSEWVGARPRLLYLAERTAL